MKEIIVRIREEDSELLRQLLEKLGAEVTERKPAKKRTTRKIAEDDREISPTLLFGKWKDLDIDSKKLRDESWARNHKFS